MLGHNIYNTAVGSKVKSMLAKRTVICQTKLCRLIRKKGSSMVILLFNLYVLRVHLPKVLYQNNVIMNRVIKRLWCIFQLKNDNIKNILHQMLINICSPDKTYTFMASAPPVVQIPPSLGWLRFQLIYHHHHDHHHHHQVLSAG